GRCHAGRARATAAPGRAGAAAGGAADRAGADVRPALRAAGRGRGRVPDADHPAGPGRAGGRDPMARRPPRAPRRAGGGRAGRPAWWPWLLLAGVPGLALATASLGVGGITGWLWVVAIASFAGSLAAWPARPPAPVHGAGRAGQA